MKSPIFRFFILALILGLFPVIKAAAFSDVPPGAWSYSYVQTAVEKGFFDNKPVFYPTRNLNRAELAKLVCKMALYTGLINDYDTTDAPKFKDITPEHWAYTYVATAAKYNLMTGYKDTNGNLTGVFGVADTVTRAQAAKAFAGASALAPRTEPEIFFQDIEQASWAREFITTMNSYAIMIGYDVNRFGVNDPVTREQTAKIITRIIEVRGEQ